MLVSGSGGFRDVGDVSVKQRYRGYDGRTDSDAFCNSFCGVAYRVEISQSLARGFIEVSHLADAVRVIRDRPEDVHRDVIPGQRQHADTAHRDAVSDIRRVRAGVYKDRSADSGRDN